MHLPGRGSLAAGLLVGARGSDLGLRLSEQLLSTNLGLLTAKATGPLSDVNMPRVKWFYCPTLRSILWGLITRLGKLALTASHFLSMPCQDISFWEGDSKHDPSSALTRAADPTGKISHMSYGNRFPSSY